MWGEKLNRFRKATQVMKSVVHPNVLPVLGSFAAGGTSCRVYPWIPRMTLSDYLDRLPGKALDASGLWSLIYPMLEALETGHSLGLIHYSLSPYTIWVTEKGVPLLAFFGDVYMETREGYSAPEVYSPAPGAFGPWTDLYSLGAVLLRALSGKTPAGVKERQEAFSRGATDPVLDDQLGDFRARLPQSFCSAISRSLRLDPEDRLRSVSEFKEVLEGQRQKSRPGRPFEAAAAAAAAQEADGPAPALAAVPLSAPQAPDRQREALPEAEPPAVAGEPSAAPGLAVPAVPGEAAQSAARGVVQAERQPQVQAETRQIQALSAEDPPLYAPLPDPGEPFQPPQAPASAAMLSGGPASYRPAPPDPGFAGVPEAPWTPGSSQEPLYSPAPPGQAYGVPPQGPWDPAGPQGPPYGAPPGQGYGEPPQGPWPEAGRSYGHPPQGPEGAPFPPPPAEAAPRQGQQYGAAPALGYPVPLAPWVSGPPGPAPSGPAAPGSSYPPSAPWAPGDPGAAPPPGAAAAPGPLPDGASPVPGTPGAPFPPQAPWVPGAPPPGPGGGPGAIPYGPPPVSGDPAANGPPQGPWEPGASGAPPSGASWPEGKGPGGK
jgi:hypothetical protein